VETIVILCAGAEQTLFTLDSNSSWGCAISAGACAERVPAPAHLLPATSLCNSQVPRESVSSLQTGHRSPKTAGSTWPGPHGLPFSHISLHLHLPSIPCPENGRGPLRVHRAHLTSKVGPGTRRAQHRGSAHWEAAALLPLALP
jgi:hypothetical protein